MSNGPLVYYGNDARMIPSGIIYKNDGVTPLFDAGALTIGDPATGGTAGSVLFIGSGPVSAQNNANFFWDNTNLTLKLGSGTPTFSAGSNIAFQTVSAAGNTYYQGIVAQNTSAGTTASTDLVLNADNATDTTNYFDFGINSSNNADGSYTLFGANEAYLYNQSAGINIGTAGSFAIKFFTGGTLSANEVARFSSAGNFGLGITSPTAQFHIVNKTAANTVFLMKGASAQVGKYLDIQDNSSTTLVNIASTGYMSVGDSTTVYRFKAIDTNANSTVQQTLTWNTSGSGGIVANIDSNVSHTSGTVTKAYCLSLNPHSSGSGGTLTNRYGLYIGADGSGTNAITTNAGIRIDTPSNAGGATITISRGLWISNQGGYATTNYALHLAGTNVSGTSNYNIYSDGTAPSYFAGKFGFNITAPVAMNHTVSTGGATIAGIFQAGTSQSGALVELRDVSATTLADFTASAAFRFPDGSVSAPGIAMFNSPSTGFYRSAANELSLSINGTQKYIMAGSSFKLKSANMYFSNNFGFLVADNGGTDRDMFYADTSNNLVFGATGYSWNSIRFCFASVTPSLSASSLGIAISGATVQTNMSVTSKGPGIFGLNGGSSSVTYGVSIGGSAGDYGVIGFNTGFGAGTTRTYLASDVAGWFEFTNVGGFKYFTAASGTAGNSITGTSRLELSTTALTLNDINMVLGTTTGTKIGTATTQKLSLWNATPIVQPTTAVAAATFVTNTSLIANDTATFDGYTIGQVVKALRNIGILA